MKDSKGNPRLEFGNIDHINMRLEYEHSLDIRALERKLVGIVRCPACGTMRKGIVEFNTKENWILWEPCQNSACSSQELEEIDTPDNYTDMHGKLCY